MLLVVIDASDPEAATHLATTLAMLKRLGADSVPRLVVFNKCDKLLEVPAIADLAREDPYVTVAANIPDTVDRLREQILDRARQTQLEEAVFVPYEHASLIRHIYANCRVSRTEAFDTGTQFTIHGEPHQVRAILRMAKECTS